MSNDGRDDAIQIVAVMPGGGFESIGLIEVTNVDLLIACMASLDTRGGRTIRPSDLVEAYARAKARQQRAPRNNDADDDGA